MCFSIFPLLNGTCGVHILSLFYHLFRGGRIIAHLSIKSSEHEEPYQDLMERTEHDSEILDVEMDVVSERGFGLSGLERT